MPARGSDFYKNVDIDPLKFENLPDASFDIVIEGMQQEESVGDKSK